MQYNDIRGCLQEIFSHNLQSNVTYIPRVYSNLAREHGMEEGLAPIKNGVERKYLEALNTKNIDHCLKILGQWAKISCDGDGVKSNNKIGTYDVGTKLLNKIATALHNKPVSDFLKNLSIEREVFTRAGGDEFDFLLGRFDGIEEVYFYEITPTILTQGTILDLFSELIVSEVTNTPFPELDFHSPYAQEKLGPYGRTLLQKAEQHSGEKFYFTPSVAIGSCTLLEGFISYLNDGADLTLPIAELAKKLMGKVEDLCAKRVETTKVQTKKILWLSDDPGQKMQAYMTIRGDSDKEFAIFKDESRRLTKIQGCLIRASKEVNACFREYAKNSASTPILNELEAIILRLENLIDLNLEEREDLEDIKKEFEINID
jgi:hypothetical protein